MDQVVKYYLGIDWGIRKIGLAVADSETRIASAFKAIEAKKAEEFIREMSRDFVFDRGIIGSYLEKDKFSANNEKIKIFMVNLERALGIKIEMAYEGFSSKIAQANLRERGAEVGQDDAESARIILQGWLDKEGKK